MNLLSKLKQAITITMGKTTFIIDGDNFSTLEGFFDEVDRMLRPRPYWGKNLDAFNDVLRGGLGTPDEGFVLLWKNSNVSKSKLAYSETAKQLERMLARSHPQNRPAIQEELDLALQNQGATVFDWLIGLIHGHPNVQLVLE